MALKERQRLSTKMSNLMLGTGKVTRFEDADKMELHLSAQDYTSLVTQRTHSHDVFSVIEIDQKKKKKDTRDSRKGSAVVLPKTYITRSGSLFLYSDSKIMKDNQETIQADLEKSQNLSVQGQAVPKVFSAGDSYPSWGRLLTPRSPSSCWSAKGKASKRERISYMRDGGRFARRVPYSWNYAVTPLKLINMASNDDLKTVHGLSEAILTYEPVQTTGSDRYANLMGHALDGGGQSKGQNGQNITGRRGNPALSNWTRSWLNTEDLDLTKFKTEQGMLTYSGHRTDPDMLALERARTNLSRQSKIYDRVPVNTPLSMTHSATPLREKLHVHRRVKTSFASQATYSEQRTPTSFSSLTEDEGK